MRWWAWFREVLPRIVRRAQDERDLEEEIQFDLAEETRLRVERGESPEAARTAVWREFGRVTAVKEDTREVWGWTLLDRMVQDVRFALRTLVNSPGFTAAAVVTLALGIGLCCFLFSSLNGMLLRPLPGARDAERLAAIEAPVSYPHFELYRDASTGGNSGPHNRGGVASAAAAFIGPVPFGVALEGAGEGRPERIFGHLVSPEYFATLGVEPMLGQFFDASELRGAAPMVVVSERFWRNRLHGDPRAAGRTLRINGQPATVVGVTEREFLGVFPAGPPADIFVPVTADPAIAPELAGDVLDRATAAVFRVVLRLAPGVTMAAAEAALEVQARAIAEQADARDPNRNRPGNLLRLIGAGGIVPWRNEQRSVFVVTFGLLIALVLSFTCANLAGLILARGSARGKEIAIRLSLGASRRRLIRQLLTESILLATAGGVAGLAAAYGLLRLLMQFAYGSAPFPSAITLTPDLRVALLTFCVSALAGAGFGLLPALATTRPDLVTALKGSAMEPGRYRRFGLRNLFLVYQMTAAMTLVLVMGFMVSGLQRGACREPGFDPGGLYLFSLDPLRDGLPADESAAVLLDLPERLARIAGVQRVAFADQALSKLLAAPDSTVSVQSSGTETKESVHRVVLQTVGPGFFATLGVPVLRGAEFSDRELRSGSDVEGILPAVINQSAAGELFGDDDPLGKILRQGDRIFQVAAVVRDDRPAPFRDRAPATVSLPLTRNDLRQAQAQGFSLIVRGREGLDFAAIREQLDAMDGRLTMFHEQTMRENLARYEESVAYVSAIYAVLGLFALTLACVGLAGITSQAVVRRQKEIGIRMALGARRPQVLGLVMKDGAVMMVVGSGLGLAGGFALTRLLGAISPQAAEGIALSASDPARVLVAPLLLITVAAVACYLPARRSAGMDPLVTLREE